MEVLRKYIVGPTPQEQVRTWQSSLRKELRQLDRQLSSISQAENRSKGQIRALAKKGDVHNCKLLAREVVRARRTRNRMEASRAMLNSLSMQMSEQLATIKITGALQKSTIMMKEVNTLVKLPEMTASMGKLQMEMAKAGILDEMITETLDMDIDDEEAEEADDEIAKIIGEITGEQFNNVPSVPDAVLAQAKVDDLEEEDTEEPDLAAMRNRLAALKE